MENPKTLIYFVTNSCNLRCRYCFNRSAGKRDTKDELSIDEIEKISRNWGRVKNLLISGGEPFLRKDFPEICRVFSSNNSTESIHIPTNGTNVVEISKALEMILSECRKTKITVSVSIDGLEDVNDSMRGKGVFKKSLSALEMLSTFKQTFDNCKVNVITTITDKNQDGIFPFFDYMSKNYSLDYHAFHPVRGEDLDPSILPPTPGEWTRISSRLLESDRQYFLRNRSNPVSSRLHLNAKRYIYNTVARSLSGESWPFKCVAGKEVAVLGAGGEISPCESLSPIFNLRDNDLNIRESLKNPHLSRSMTCSVVTSPICNKCTHSCFLVPSLLSSPFHLIRSVSGL